MKEGRYSEVLFEELINYNKQFFEAIYHQHKQDLSLGSLLYKHEHKSIIDNNIVNNNYNMNKK